MKVVVAPDKFKGSLTSFEACRAISKGLKKAIKETDVIEFPMADGGDGFATVLAYYLKTEIVSCHTVDPLNRHIVAAYQWESRCRTAIIEMAVASGLVLLKEEERNPLVTSTFGTGVLIKHAIEKGAEKIILGLGGSATNDGGTGILSALGFQFIDKDGGQLKASGENLMSIRKIVAPSFIPTIRFEIAYDVQNILFGNQGAAYIYAPQKGAGREQVETLDNGLKNLAAIIMDQQGKDVSEIPGSGAAGGIAAGLMAFFDVMIIKGTELVINASQIENSISGVDLVITGEGKIDDQTSEGKVVGHIAALATKYQIPCVAICGISSIDENESGKIGLKKIISLQDERFTLQESMDHAAVVLEEKAGMAFDYL